MDDVVVERRQSMKILRINRPEARNTLTPAVLTALGDGLLAGDDDPEVRVTIVTGTGDRAFCAGMDLKAFAQAGSSSGFASESYQQFIRQGVKKPVIGAANGAAVAGGFELLLACDMVVASTEARFGLPETKVGLFPAGGGVFLGRRIPLGVALELVMTGELIDARRAEALGLVNRLTAPHNVLEEALSLAERISANGPLALGVVKRLLLDAVDLPRDEVWRRQDEASQPVFASADAKEGAQAFIEKRSPLWQGR